MSKSKRSKHPSISCQITGCYGKATQIDNLLKHPTTGVQFFHFDCQHGHKFHTDKAKNPLGSCDCPPEEENEDIQGLQGDHYWCSHVERGEALTVTDFQAVCHRSIFCKRLEGMNSEAFGMAGAGYREL